MLLTVLLKLLSYIGILGSAGLCLVIAIPIVEQRAHSLWLKRAWVAALSGLIATFADMVLSAQQLGDVSFIVMVLDIQKGSIIALLSGCALVGISMFVKPPISRACTLLAAFVLAGSFGLKGHSQGLEAPAFWPLIVGAHVMLASFWFVAPLILWPHKTLDQQALVVRVGRFGLFAIWLVPLLFSGGFVLALKLAGGLSGLMHSPYGAALGVKLSAALIALGLGALNKLSIARSLYERPAQATSLLKWTLGFDVLLFLVALIAVTLATSVFGVPSSA